MNLMNLKVVGMIVVSLKINLVSLLFGHSYPFFIFNVFESSKISTPTVSRCCY